MAVRFPERFVEEVRNRADLVAIVSQHVELRRVGASLRGLCPFHGEKTPSFYVHPERQRYHCFGCQASGDVFSFVMEVDGWSFPEAISQLAASLGLELPNDDNPKQSHRQRLDADEESTRLYRAMDVAATAFSRWLQAPATDADPGAGIARDALRARGVSMDTAMSFRLGYAPHAWTRLADHLHAEGVSMRDAIAAGLVAPRKQGPGVYDRFRHRLMFPVSDAYGKVIAFSGRLLDEPAAAGSDRAISDRAISEQADSQPASPAPHAASSEPTREAAREPAREAPKYINSPETRLYQKGHVLFGLHQARVTLRRSRQAILCEGNFDVVKLHAEGFSQAIAPLGTAFTAEQARAIGRYASEVCVVFDADRAGMKAMEAAFPLLSEAGLRAHCLLLPDGDDPDSFLRREGAEAFGQRLAQAKPLIHAIIDRAAWAAGDDGHAKGQAIEALGGALAAVENPVERRLLLERVAQRFGMRDLGIVRQTMLRGYQRAKTLAQRRAAPSMGASTHPGERNTAGSGISGSRATGGSATGHDTAGRNTAGRNTAGGNTAGRNPLAREPMQGRRSAGERPTTAFGSTGTQGQAHSANASSKRRFTGSQAPDALSDVGSSDVGSSDVGSSDVGSSDAGSSGAGLSNAGLSGGAPATQRHVQSARHQAASDAMPSVLELALLRVAIDRPEALRFAVPEPEDAFAKLLTNPSIQDIVAYTIECLRRSEQPKADEVLRRCDSSALRAWVEQQLSVAEFDSDEAASDHLRQVMAQLHKRQTEQSLARLQRQILEARQNGNEALASALTEKHSQLFQSVAHE